MNATNYNYMTIGNHKQMDYALEYPKNTNFNENNFNSLITEVNTRLTHEFPNNFNSDIDSLVTKQSVIKNLEFPLIKAISFNHNQYN